MPSMLMMVALGVIALLAVGAMVAPVMAQQQLCLHLHEVTGQTPTTTLLQRPVSLVAETAQR